jgi:hypothetical protein
MSPSLKDGVYVDKPWLHMWWDSEHECLRSQWKAFANSAEFRAGLMKALDAIRERHAVRYVSDTRKVKVIVHADQEWVTETWVPLMAAAGLRRFGLVTADAGLGKLTVEEVIAEVHDRGFLMHKFDSVDAAMKWAADA